MSEVLPMETIDILIKIGAALTAIVTIFTIARKVIKFFTNLEKDIKEMKEHTHENYMGQLRLTIMSSDMPLGERMVAADKYLKANGNGEVKKFIISELHFQEVQHDK